MTAFELLSPPQNEAERNRRIYDGHVLVFRDVPALHRLTARLVRLVESRFGGEPERVHTRLDVAGQAEAAETIRQDVARDEATRDLLTETLREVGADLSNTFRDPLKLRMQPPAVGQDSALVAPLAAHRDTWGSNVMAQTNWWAPALPITAERTIALFPQAFRKPVPNDSAAWDLEAFLAARREGRDYPMLPAATETPDPATAVPFVIAPGDLLCFSGAHLHASVVNSTGTTRFSLEWRSVNGPDAKAGHGAPNVDGRAPWITDHWFKHALDGTRLGERRRA